jgi:DNA-binding LytR/AlgR family response regulator
MKIKCIIIDDEPLARKGIKEYVEDIDYLELCGEFDTPVKAAGMLSEKPVDLIFLDIQMPKINGIDFLKSLTHPPLVIFTTAYPQFAVQGFELNAIDYLLKPFSFERFMKAVMKAKAVMTGSIKTEAVSVATSDDHFFIKTDNKLLKIRFDEILFIEALQNYISIQTTDKKYISYLTFKSMEESLPQELFLKVHKSYLVSIAKISSITGNELTVGNHHIPVSRGLKDEVMERLLKGKFLKR